MQFINGPFKPFLRLYWLEGKHGLNYIHKALEERRVGKSVLRLNPFLPRLIGNSHFT